MLKTEDRNVVDTIFNATQNWAKIFDGNTEYYIVYGDIKNFKMLSSI